MDASKIINDQMTLEEKLAAIDAAMKAGAQEFNKKNGRPLNTPVDPAELTVCEGCE